MILSKFVVLSKHSQPILSFEVKQTDNRVKVCLKAATGI